MTHKVNFNRIENQDRCSFHQEKQKVFPVQYVPIPLQYFINVRNYGWTRYQGVLYNLNIEDQAQAFIQVLKDEKFLLEGNRAYTICDENYSGFVNIPRHMLLYYMSYMKADPLTLVECEERDQLITSIIQ